jgi:hypothetical protein
LGVVVKVQGGRFVCKNGRKICVKEVLFNTFAFPISTQNATTGAEYMDRTSGPQLISRNCIGA